MKHKLIINADDFGYTKGVTTGILDAHLNGVVSSTTALTMGEYFKEAIELAKEHPSLGVGVHLTLTLKGSKPILKGSVKTLTDDQGFFNASLDITTLDLKEVEDEWRAQIETFLATDMKPTHLDSHHNVHGFHESILEVALRLAKEYNLPLRNPIRHPSQDNYISMLSIADVKTPQKMYNEFYGDNENFATLEFITTSIINSEDEISEFNCHPAHIDQRLKELSSYVSMRQKELELLNSSEVRALLKEKDITLVSYRVFNK